MVPANSGSAQLGGHQASANKSAETKIMKSQGSSESYRAILLALGRLLGSCSQDWSLVQAGTSKSASAIRRWLSNCVWLSLGGQMIDYV